LFTVAHAMGSTLTQLGLDAGQVNSTLSGILA
jgi:hypothetical protein